MSTLFVTFLIAFAIILIALAALGLSWLLKGKSSIRSGTCGRDPTKKRDDNQCNTNSSCNLCDDKKSSDEKPK